VSNFVYQSVTVTLDSVKFRLSVDDRADRWQMLAAAWLAQVRVGRHGVALAFLWK
jgi:hypothetical protein